MTWGILAVIALGLFLTYVIWQETRSHLHWRALVAEGNAWAVHELVTAEIERWHRIRPPGGVSAALWAGVQTAELVALGAHHVQLACGTEGEYRMVGGRREQSVSALDAAMRLASKLVEMVLYDIPEVKLDCVRIDVYSTFRSPEGVPEQRCILSTVASRDTANTLDWETMTPRQVVDCFTSRYALDAHGTAREIDPGPAMENEPLEEAMPPEVRGRRGAVSRAKDARRRKDGEQ